MAGLKGKLNPFRITRDEFVDLVERIEQKIDIDSISADIDRFSVDSPNAKTFKVFLKDLRLPGALSNISFFIHGTPTIYFYCSKDSASYSISGADTLDQATLIEDIIQAFFTKHRIYGIFSPDRWWPIFIIFLLGAFLELFLSVCTLLGIALKVQVIYPGLHLFSGLLFLTLLGFIIWSYNTSNPPYYSFVHSVLYIDRKEKSNALISLVSVIIVDLTVSIILQFII